MHRARLADSPPAPSTSSWVSWPSPYLSLAYRDSCGKHFHCFFLRYTDEPASTACIACPAGEESDPCSVQCTPATTDDANAA